MKTTGMAVIAAAMLAVAGSARAAEDDPSRDDVRCVLAMSAMLQMQNAQLHDAAVSGLFYFAGRIEGRDAHYDLEAAMTREARRMSTTDYGAEMKRCGGELKAKNEGLKAAGDALKAKMRSGV